MIEVKLHDIGEGMTEGEIVHYLIKEGDHVTADQPLVEVQTDKMVAELPSPGNGTIKKIVVKSGETVQVGTTLLYIETDDQKDLTKSSLQSTVPEQKEEKVRQNNSLIEYKRVLATPYTRKIARDHQVDIEAIQPRDPSGRVTEEDIYRFLKMHQEKPTTLSRLDKPAKMLPSIQQDELPFRGIRKKIANNMSRSLYTIPHVTHFDEVDMTNLMQLRKAWKEDGRSISIPAFFIKALIIALKEFPVFNAELDEKNEKIILKRDYHIGIATDTEEGLMVPVVRNAHLKTLKQIHEEIKRLTKMAQTNQLKRDDIGNSTFTISNVGPLGSIGATPIINFPETALIAFHKTKKMPVVNKKDEIVIRQIMTLSLSFDHRVTDGATAVRFTNRFSELIANPTKLMLEMI